LKHWSALHHIQEICSHQSQSHTNLKSHCFRKFFPSWRLWTLSCWSLWHFVFGFKKTESHHQHYLPIKLGSSSSLAEGAEWISFLLIFGSALRHFVTVLA
jgi:hypothetical protein